MNANTKIFKFGLVLGGICVLVASISLLAFAWAIWKSPIVAFEAADDALINNRSHSLSQAVDWPSLKLDILDKINRRIENKSDPDKSTCSKFKNIIKYEIRFYIVDRYLDVGNFRAFLIGKAFEGAVDPYFQKFKNHREYEYIDFDTIARVVKLKDMPEFKFIYARQGVLNWRIVRIDGIPLDKLSDAIIEYEAEVLKDYGALCAAAHFDNRPSGKDASASTAKSITKKQIKKSRKLWGAFSENHVSSIFKRACEIQKSLIRQGFKLHPVNCR